MFKQQVNHDHVTQSRYFEETKRILNHEKTLIQEQGFGLICSEQAIQLIAEQIYVSTESEQQNQQIISNFLNEYITDEMIYGNLQEGHVINIDADDEDIMFYY
ncbi:hypothetical protein J3T65_09440 [Staphylococcus simiae]|uniref:hypothetical protein n=1 Tax=Staphylococcus simiae TaxID=308354 RepID=UPI001A95C2FB|nr:hypothetical protein [Staphylococcus simiae]MBO1199413.1 hypothetical protein [Staphylococcus simiae]MBO1201894.1 hypothetical protein [Staphylococcus simiae]MBO1204108.1 hypothetical protein [Staphylococcus simiae]MBO1211125.1 hypothetical protein [Staphylococcus simiae]MBO1230343.1 hypothetical protein [Staphylococcus simiae]